MKRLLLKKSMALLLAVTSLGATGALLAQDDPKGRVNPPVETVKLSSGVLVEHFILGTGKAPKARDKVTVHYLGRLSDGTTFDSSYQRREPSSFYLNEVVECWTRGMQEIKEGGYARIGCPAHTAYGKQGIPGVIPPDSILFFDVELISVN